MINTFHLSLTTGSWRNWMWLWIQVLQLPRIHMSYRSCFLFQRATGVNHNTWGKALFGGCLCLLTAFLFITVETAKSETWILNVGQVSVFFHFAQQEIGLRCRLSEDFVHWLCLPLRPLEFLQIKKEQNWNETQPPTAGRDEPCLDRWANTAKYMK